MKKLPLLLSISAALLFTACESRGPSEVTSPSQLPVADRGHHELPTRVSENLVVTKIQGAKEYMQTQKVRIHYELDGRKRVFFAQAIGDSDGTFRNLGLIHRPEKPGREGPIRTELICLTPDGREITVRGNTVNEGQIYLGKRRE